MRIDQKKMRELVGRTSPYSPDELRREANVFYVGGDLPERQTIETLYDSHFQSNAALFHLTFGDEERFARAENLARLIKKNFNAYLVGRVDFCPSQKLVERAYAAGVDILDIPLHAYDHARSRECGWHLEARLRSLDSARAVFPRWSVVSSLDAGCEPAGATVAGIDALLERDIVPLVQLTAQAAALPPEQLTKVFNHLQRGWQQKRALIKPLLPLIFLVSPFAPASPKGILRGFIDSIEDRRLLAGSDLRRLLRVKEVAESYESSGL
ncbi:hypothetical protein M1B72_12470 [Geomonas paludis]|uniref:Uncharacterized protein n=1 Tax=Geomonas paludis TaxID=2740185 RepID=A0A6V8MVN5_9BACT|nr:hypothetical protein [Geomonas paludis]UPU34263.1 hypothetical protein M1B72_12470 [Geomonas paludis]GFO64245.1 hypothetical protein GMPD_21640 [Geomonas paludis]